MSARHPLPQPNDAALSFTCLAVIEATKLPAKDHSGTSDPYVVLSVNGKRFRTKTVKKTLTPAWNETFYFYLPAHQQRTSVEVDVYDWDAVGK